MFFFLLCSYLLFGFLDAFMHSCWPAGFMQQLLVASFRALAPLIRNYIDFIREPFWLGAFAAIVLAVWLLSVCVAISQHAAGARVRGGLRRETH